MKKFAKVGIVLIAIVLLGTSCLNAPTGATAGTKYDATQDQRITSLEGIILGPNGLQALVGALNTKIAGFTTDAGVASRVSSLETRLATAESKLATGGGASTTTTDALSARIKTLEDWKAGLGTSTPTGGVSDTGSVTFTNNPVAIPQIFSSSSGGNSNPWIMTIHNGSTTWQYVKAMVSLNVASGQPSSIVTDVSLMESGGNCSLTGTYLVPGNFTFSPSNMGTVATPSIIIFPISGCNGSGEWYIGPGQTQSYNIQVQGLKTPNPILWNVSASISSRSM
jgi:hypothetical protein